MYWCPEIKTELQEGVLLFPHDCNYLDMVIVHWHILTLTEAQLISPKQQSSFSLQTPYAHDANPLSSYLPKHAGKCFDYSKLPGGVIVSVCVFWWLIRVTKPVCSEAKPVLSGGRVYPSSIEKRMMDKLNSIPANVIYPPHSSLEWLTSPQSISPKYYTERFKYILFCTDSHSQYERRMSPLLYEMANICSL